jgi:hypothetical protein
MKREVESFRENTGRIGEFWRDFECFGVFLRVLDQFLRGESAASACGAVG